MIVTIDEDIATGALFAATNPSRTTALVELEGFDDTVTVRPDGLDRDKTRAAVVANWGTGEWQRVMNPDIPWNEEIRATWARMERLAASPGTVALMMPLLYEVDVRAVCSQSACRPSWFSTPTTRSSARIGSRTSSTYRARNTLSCRGATCTTSSSRGGSPSGDRRVPHRPAARSGRDRVLATVLFTDIVDSTRRAAEMGDRDWHALLDAHDAVVRAQLTRFRGREVNTSGDGFLAMFDGPQRAIRCAMAIRDVVQSLGIEVRAGLHTGECEVRGDDIGGIAVHIGARVSALAGPNDVLVSNMLRDLVIGSGLKFEERGAQQLKGVPGEWRLFAVASA